MGTEKSADYYDELLQSKTYTGPYLNHPLYKAGVYNEITEYLDVNIDKKKDGILEISCGTGQFAEYLKELGFDKYHGVDFSEKAIELARKRVEKLKRRFHVANILEEAAYKYKKEVVIAMEVLEHIKDDHKVFENLPSGTVIIFSVPSFDDPAHVRHFNTWESVCYRYSKYLRPGASTKQHSLWFLTIGIVK